ncbi:MAG: nitroreductase [Bacteroidales bacterium]|nr:nitroreductase [Bacteroidales bacterium]
MKLNNLILVSALLIIGCSNNTTTTAVLSEKTPTEQCNDNEKVEYKSTIDIINTRRSVRMYKTTPISRDTLNIIAECGIKAPSGMNLQPWEVRILDNQDMINQMSEIYKEDNQIDTTLFRNMFRNAVAVIFLGAPKNTHLFDSGLLAENMMLAAWSMGIGSCCQGGPINLLKTNPKYKFFMDKLDFPEDYELIMCIGFGYPGDTPKPTPRNANKIKYIE